MLWANRFSLSLIILIFVYISMYMAIITSEIN